MCVENICMSSPGFTPGQGISHLVVEANYNIVHPRNDLPICWRSARNEDFNSCNCLRKVFRYNMRGAEAAEAIPVRVQFVSSCCRTSLALCFNNCKRTWATNNSSAAHALLIVINWSASSICEVHRIASWRPRCDETLQSRVSVWIAPWIYQSN
jgi:hypothetical protein